MIRISVAIPVYNPPPGHIGPTLEALRAQSLPPDEWDLVLVDNRSKVPVTPDLVAWHPHGKVVREETPGLVAARLAGFAHTCGGVIAVVDQDNVLAPDFLATALRLGEEHPWLGTWGGVITGRFERPDLAPPPSLYPLLTLRSAEHDLWSNDPDHHDSTPWGAGLCVRRNVADAYAAALRRDPRRGRLDLCGDQRLAGGDTDLCYTGCAMGLGKGVFRALKLEHLIPAERCTAAYLCKNAHDRGYSDTLHYYLSHGQLPPRTGRIRETLRRLWHGRHLTPIERKVRAAQLAGRRRAWEELSRTAPSP
ncbi:MAG: glycosyltransferase family 2 protein [Verrucomicrobiota bacterium]